MVGDSDPFEMFLARELSMTVRDMRDRMPQAEYIEWRAWFAWRKAMEEVGGG